MHLRLPSLQLLLTRLFLVFSLCILCLELSAKDQGLGTIVSAQVGGVAPGETIQTNPKNRSNTVTAQVRDQTPPTTPILIAPENNAILRTSKPTFVWKSEPGGLGLAGFDLFLDGTRLFADIPPYSVDTNLYTLIYDPVTGYYSLLPKNTINDGLHTWKIVAKDTNGNISTSVTWSFTLDTTAPHLIITGIDETPVSISSQDISSVPTTPVVIYETNPLLTGTGEANASVTLVVSFADNRPTQTYTFTIGGDGTWQVQLSALPLNQILYLDFTITDAVGNLSFLEDVPLIIRTKVGVGATPTTTIPAEPDVTFPPAETPGPTPITIPDILKPLPLPFPFELFTSGFLEKISPITDNILLDNFIVLLLLLLVLVTKLILILWPLQFSISIAIFKNAFWMLFFAPFVKKLKRGLVFDHETGRPVPYAPVYVTQHFDTHTKQETVLFSDRDGLLYDLPNDGHFSFAIDQPTCLFPTAYSRPSTLQATELYRGEVILFEPNTFPTLFIPVNRFSEIKLSFREKILLGLQLVRQPTNIFFFSLCTVLTLLFPTVINLGATLLYLLALLLFYLGNKGSVERIHIYDTQKQALEYFILKVKLPHTDEIIDFDVSSSKGTCIVEIPVDSYVFDVYRLGWELVSGTEPVIMSFTANNQASNITKR